MTAGGAERGGAVVPNESRREVLFVAGEASGDLHAAGVADELARLRPEGLQDDVALVAVRLHPQDG